MTTDTIQNNSFDEKDAALKIANVRLDEPYTDPDSDICILARQYIRLLEANTRIREAALKEGYEQGYNEGYGEGFKKGKKATLREALEIIKDAEIDPSTFSKKLTEIHAASFNSALSTIESKVSEMLNQK